MCEYISVQINNYLFTHTCTSPTGPVQYIRSPVHSADVKLGGRCSIHRYRNRLHHTRVQHGSMCVVHIQPYKYVYVYTINMSMHDRVCNKYVMDKRATST